MKRILLVVTMLLILSLTSVYANTWGCWNCGAYGFERSETYNCGYCGWDICPNCGACRQGGCEGFVVEYPTNNNSNNNYQNNYDDYDYSEYDDRNPYEVMEKSKPSPAQQAEYDDALSQYQKPKEPVKEDKSWSDEYGDTLFAFLVGIFLVFVVPYVGIWIYGKMNKW